MASDAVKSGYELVCLGINDSFWLVLLLSVNICLQSVESEEACWFKCEKNKKCVYHPKEGRKVCVLKRCLKPKSHGFCRRYTQRYYFDHKTFECNCFKYGGCYGSRNNFLTKLACESRCFPPPLEKPNGYITARPDSTAPPKATETSMANTSPNTLTNTTATMTQLTITTNAAAAPMVTMSQTSLTGITETFATTKQLGSSTSPTTAVQPTTTISPTTPITSMVITTQSATTMQNIVSYTSPQQASTCNATPSVPGLTFFPEGGANINQTKAYRCAERNRTFAVYSLISMICPIITCQSDGTYSPSPINLCTVPLNSPPGDNTLTIPGTISSPGYDSFSNYPVGEAQYRWNIVTVGHTIGIHFIVLDLPNTYSSCPRGLGDVIEIYCGFTTQTADFKFCNSNKPSSTIYCSQSCIVILLLLNNDTATGFGFSLIWL